MQALNYFFTHLTGKKTGHKMIRVNFPELRCIFPAGVFRIQAARMEAASRRRIYGAGDVAF
jgi:hypothetical protein